MPSDEALTDGELSLVPTSGADRVRGFAITVDGERRGTVALVNAAKGRAELRWNATHSARDDGTLVRGLRLAVTHAFDDLGLGRLETFVDADDLAAMRTASIAGLRREGVLRARGDAGDQVLMARVAGDPDPLTQEGFIAILNAGLPTKRVIAQGILRDTEGRVLLCELTYKREWDLPGGVIERGESPAVGLVRELAEELGIEVTVRGLLTVNWLPPWRGWDDACVFVFDLGEIPSNLVQQMTFQRTEIRGVHWCDDRAVKEHATRATIELLEALSDPALPPYREASSE